MTLKPKHWGALIMLLFIAYFSYLGNKPTHLPRTSFPSPNYSKGKPIGFDFKKGDYNYYIGSAKDLGISVPKPKKQEDPTLYEMIEQYIEDNRDEILEHLHY